MRVPIGGEPHRRRATPHRGATPEASHTSAPNSPNAPNDYAPSLKASPSSLIGPTCRRSRVWFRDYYAPTLVLAGTPNSPSPPKTPINHQDPQPSVVAQPPSKKHSVKQKNKPKKTIGKSGGIRRMSRNWRNECLTACAFEQVR